MTKRESSVEITQNLRKTRAKILQNFRKFGAPRAQKLRALGHRALRMLQNAIKSLPIQHCIQIRIKQATSVGITQILRPTRAKELQNFRKKIGAPRAQNLREVGQRCCAKRRTSLQFFYESVCNLI